jgi:ubiquinone/menaquinone biosynthesis C-methylase UbiE
MNKTWIHEQTESNVLQWDGAMEKHYPESTKWLRNSDDYFVRLCQECNYLEAVKLIDWKSYLDKGSHILDMGCGGGWLTAYLSAFESVGTIYALDSSKRFLTDLVPHIVNKMGGRQEKIVTVQGLFTPLLFQGASLNLVVASSALHHAESLEGVLQEARRVLKKDGLLFILNETPSPYLRFLLACMLGFARIMKKLVIRNYESTSPSISACGYLNNPYLGDKSYPLWYWKEAISRAGFSIVEIVDTGLPTVKNTRGINLTHFICKAI